MRILILCFGIGIILATTACHENIDVFVPFESDLSALENGDIDRLFYDLNPEVSTIEWEASNHLSWSSPGGTRLTVPANSFTTLQGEEIQEGLISINLVEMLSAGQMIIHDKPNVASGNILEAAGNFYLEAHLNGEPLTLADDKLIQLQLPGAPVNNSLNPEMELFWGNNQNAQFFNWEPFDNADLAVHQIEYLDSSAMAMYQAYQFASDRLGWLGCSAPILENQQWSTLCVNLPEGFTSKNTAVFLVFQNFKGVAKLFEDEAAETNTFCKHLIPTFSDGQVVVLTEGGDGGYYFRYVPIHLDSPEVSFFIQPQRTDIETITNFLNEL